MSFTKVREGLLSVVEGKEERCVLKQGVLEKKEFLKLCVSISLIREVIAHQLREIIAQYEHTVSAYGFGGAGEMAPCPGITLLASQSFSTRYFQALRIIA